MGYYEQIGVENARAREAAARPKRLVDRIMRAACWLGLAVAVVVAWIPVLLPFVQIFRALTGH